MLTFGMRLGQKPRYCITTTPRPIPLINGTGRDGQRLGLKNDPLCRVVTGSSYENRSNLADTYFSKIIMQHEGTRLGRQEIYAEILEDVEGALWTRAALDERQLKGTERPPPMSRIVVAIDPAVSSSEEADETGLIVAGRAGNGYGYVLEDLSGRYKPAEWAKIAIQAYRKYSADRIVAEVNNGGEMVENTIRMIDPNVAFRAVHASRGKMIRAEPVAALYEATGLYPKGRIRHAQSFPRLEDQMCNFTGERSGYSPDRVDALVWALTELLVRRGTGISQFRPGQPQHIPLYARWRSFCETFLSERLHARH
jgi:predicted phage terminase large subunit-like protein